MLGWTLILFSWKTTGLVLIMFAVKFIAYFLLNMIFFACRGALMADAMILPCGHTFGAGGIEQVKQMVQSFVSSITSSLFFCSLLFAYEICFLSCSLRKLAAHVHSQSQKT